MPVWSYGARSLCICAMFICVLYKIGMRLLAKKVVMPLNKGEKVLDRAKDCGLVPKDAPSGHPV